MSLVVTLFYYNFLLFSRNIQLPFYDNLEICWKSSLYTSMRTTLDQTVCNKMAKNISNCHSTIVIEIAQLCANRRRVPSLRCCFGLCGRLHRRFVHKPKVVSFVHLEQSPIGLCEPRVPKQQRPRGTQRPFVSCCCFGPC